MSGLRNLWRRILFSAPPRAEVLVFDREGADLLKLAVLHDIPHSVLETRFECYYITVGILARCIANLAWINWRFLGRARFNPRRIRAQLYTIYLLACVQTIKPRVVITFIDNNWQFQIISRQYRQAEFFAIQNGVRSKYNLLYDTPRLPHPAHKISMPHLFCFGNFEPVAYSAFGHTVDHFHPVGSLKAGYYLAEIAPRRPPIDFDVCVVSQWSDDVMLGTAFPEIRKSLAIMDELLSGYLRTHPLHACVALRLNHPEEIAYFRRQYGNGVELIPQNREAFSTYAAIDRSKLIMVLDSTAGREAYGWGKKVLFCNFTGREIFDTPAHEWCCTTNADRPGFAATIERLLCADDLTFTSVTASNRAHLMFSAGKSPQSLIRDSITEIVEGRIQGRPGNRTY